jgi:hypothetical protein
MRQLLTIFAQAIENCPENASETNSCLTNLPQVNADGSALTTILSIVFGTISAVAMIIIIVQSLRFVLSSGEPEKAAEARKGIIYALIGLVISLSANVIVVFVLKDIL